MNSIRELLPQVLAQIDQLGPLAPVVFVPFYIVCTALFVPTAMLALGGGALFGLPVGFVLVYASFLMSAAIAFLTGRYFSRAWLLKKIAPHEKFKALDETVAVQGRKIVLLLRFAAVFPFTFLNYALGLTKISFKDYFLATSVGMFPGVLLYVYLGSLVHHVASMAEGRDITLLEWIFSGFGLAVTFGIGFYAARKVKKALKVEKDPLL